MMERIGARAAIVIACAALAPLAFATSAYASPVEGPAGEAFYTPPSPLPEGGHGTLIWYRPMTVNLNVTLPGVKAWRVLYKSTNQVGEADSVTGTVIVPTESWKGSGERPVVSYAEGTQGLGHQCAPSLQIEAGTEYDGGAIIAALKKGYAVVVTDYQGYTNGSTPAYIAGRDEGQAVLDIVKAAQQLPGSGVGTGAPVIIWGYSQGGQAAGWAGQLIKSYAPELNVKGVAVGGVPANLTQIAEFSEGTPGSAFGLDSFIGLLTAYESLANPETMLEETLNQQGLEAIKKLKSECAIQSLEQFHDAKFSSFDKKGETLAQLQKSNVVIGDIVNQQKLGTIAIPVPVYHYHGLQDEFVPVKQDVELHYAWCKLGVQDDFQLYPGDHLLTDPTAIPYVMGWIAERLEGKPAPSTCGQHSESSALPANARLTPEQGDLVVPIPGWELSGTVTAAKLGIPLKLPSGSTLTSEADVTSGKLTAQLFVPPIDETITLFGFLPVNIQGSLTQAGPIEGRVGLSGSGVLTLEATGGSILEAKSISIAFLSIPLGCHTERPIEMPLKVSEAANALSTGSLSFSDTVTIPPFTGCNFFVAPLVTALLSGPGNKLEITARPPAPISW